MLVGYHVKFDWEVNAVHEQEGNQSKKGDELVSTAALAETEPVVWRSTIQS
jgi:hypothetical protein